MTKKVYDTSGYKYQSTSTIMLKGNWLKELGFHIGDTIAISRGNGRPVIIPDTERDAFEKAESEFMEREMMCLQKKFEEENIHLQLVLERKAGYGIWEG